MHEARHSKAAHYFGNIRAFVFVLGALLVPTSLGQEDFFKPDMGLHCLATAIYHEARGEPLKGQRAVVDVIINRAWKSGKTFCEILTAPGQFQWTKHHDMRYDVDHLLDEALKEPRVLKNENFFYSTSVKPSWAAKMQCQRIGHHNFCKERTK